MRNKRFLVVVVVLLLLAASGATILLFGQPTAPIVQATSTPVAPTVATIEQASAPPGETPSVPPPTETAAPPTPTAPSPTVPPATETPLPTSGGPTLPFFGVSMRHVAEPFGLTQAREAGVQVVRDPTIPWNVVEPVRTDPPTYHWEALQGLEEELVNAAEAGITVTLLFLYTPDWAQAVPGHSCGAIREDQLGAFAEFLQAAVARYSVAPYHVRYWELFNEPDVDPGLVPADSGFGCWGDQNDEFYGGRTFAEMLKHAYPAIKQADPEAQVISGGLLLDAPEGLPTQFFRGILEGGGGDYFDFLAFHAYTFFFPETYNWDVVTGTKWIDWNGVVIGKTTFLQQLLREYGYDKPLVLNEAGLSWIGSGEPSDAYRQSQADYVVKLHARALALGLANVTWFGWQGPGWRYMALLNKDLSPTPAYHAYAFAIQQLDGVQRQYVGPTDYEGLEGYTFRRDGKLLQVVWSADGGEHVLSVPTHRFVQAFDVNGAEATHELVQDSVRFTVRRPLYVELEP